LVDSAHNPHGAQALAAAIHDSFTFDRLIGVVGVLGDKDAAGVLGALEPILDAIVITTPASARAMPAEDLAANCRRSLSAGKEVMIEPESPRGRRSGDGLG
jgi:dihydrofolate synthase/folylpolyglutamate synthase